MRNNHDGGFTDVTRDVGLGVAMQGMGVAVGDYDNDGLIDFYITNFSDDSNTLYHNDGEGNFTDVTFQAGLGEPTIPFLGWGTAFLDFDGDGWKDVVVANGHVYPAVDGQQWGTSYAQQLLLFRNAEHTDAQQAAKGVRARTLMLLTVPARSFARRVLSPK